MEKPSVFSVSIYGHTIELPVVQLSKSPVSIALADTLGDWRLCDTLADCMMQKAAEMNLDLAQVEVILTAGKAVTLAESLARKLNVTDVSVAEKSVKSFWLETFQVPSKSITGGKTEQLIIGGRRAAMLKGKRILVIDDVISTGESIHALSRIAAHFGEVVVVMAPFVEGDQETVLTQVEGYPAVTLVYLPVWPDA